MRLINKDITFIDYPDPSDWAVIFYVSGCCHNCIGCQNKELQDPNIGGNEIKDINSLYKLIKDASIHYKTKKIVFSGGDPLYETNRDLIREFLKKYGNEFEICIYTGYPINFVKEQNISGFKFIKCGRYIYTDSQYRKPGITDDKFTLASSNQDFYDENYNKISINGILKFR